MSDAAIKQSEVIVVGFGSPHGDDQAGWKLVSRLGKRPVMPARLARVHEATQLISELEGCRKLIVVDACRGSGPVGTISRFCWPDPRIGRHGDRSTHEIGLSSALELANQLGKLPGEIVVFSVEIGSEKSVGTFSGEVRAALDELEAVVVAEIGEVAR